MDNMSLQDILLYAILAGAGLTVAFRFSKKKSQSQSAKNSSIAIQSGRDTKIREE